MLRNQHGNALHGKNGKKKKGKKNNAGPKPQKLQRNEVIERSIPGFKAVRYRAKLTYYDTISLTTGTGAAGVYVYSANGLYDPDITGTGHQPMTFDQLMLSFEHYCVMNAKMTANFRNPSTSYTLSSSISLNAGSATVTNEQALVENGLIVRDRLALSPSDDSVKTLSMPINLSKYGSVPSIMSDPEHHGTISANPTEQAYFQLSVWTPDTVTSISGVTVEVYIEYDAWFFEPRKNSVSINRRIRDLIIAEERASLEFKR